MRARLHRIIKLDWQRDRQACVCVCVSLNAIKSRRTQASKWKNALELHQQQKHQPTIFFFFFDHSKQIDACVCTFVANNFGKIQFAHKILTQDCILLVFESIWLRFFWLNWHFFDGFEYQQCDRYGVSNTIAVRLCLVHILMWGEMGSAAIRHFLKRLRCFFLSFWY